MQRVCCGVATPQSSLLGGFACQTLPCFGCDGTSVVLERSLLAASGGEEVMCSEPGDTSSAEGDGADLAANEAANGAMFSSIIRSVIVPADRNHT